MTVTLKTSSFVGEDGLEPSSIYNSNTQVVFGTPSGKFNRLIMLLGLLLFFSENDV